MNRAELVVIQKIELGNCVILVTNNLARVVACMNMSHAHMLPNLCH